MHLYHTVFAVRLSLLSFAVTALLPSQCYHHAAVTPLTFHNQTVKLQSVTDDSKFIFFIYWIFYQYSHTFVAETWAFGFLITSSGLFALTLVFAGMDSVIKVLPPIIVFSPTTVSPPSTVELE